MLACPLSLSTVEFRCPRLIAAAEIRCVRETKALQRVCGEGGAVTLVAVDHDRVQQLAVSTTLFERTDVDDQRTGRTDGREVGGIDPVKSATTLLEQAADGRAIVVGHVPTIRKAEARPLGPVRFHSSARFASIEVL